MQAFKRSVRQGIAKGEFKLYYQPIINLHSKKIAGHEALIRWHHPVDDLLMPIDFIPACESDPNLMVEICEFVVKQSWRDRKRLLHGFISVNIAPSSLEMPRFWDVLNEYSLVDDHPSLYLELVERLLTNYTVIAPHFKGRVNTGVGAFIDDFGVGESGFIQVAEVLKWFPSNDFVKIKLDIEFARNLKNETYQWFAKSIIDAMHDCPSGRIAVIAEGIEHEWQLEIFKSIGCDYGQGWLWGKAEMLGDN